MARRRRPPRAGAISELPPLKIFSQIVALQALYYIFAFILLLFTALVAGTPFTLDLVFGWSQVRGDTTQGWLLGFIWILDGGLLIGISQVLLISRSKLVPDFSISLHLIHLVVVYLYTSALPQHAAWYVTNVLSSVLCILLATWGCQYRELKPIAFGGHGSSSSASNQNNNSHNNNSNDNEDDQGGGGVGGDEEQGFTRGRGRGRGRDGGGEYEMVNILPSGSGSGTGSRGAAATTTTTTTTTNDERRID
ncbi:putative integral membrane protein [Cladorrhinum samala]|uniref:Integral membrane protein n=1 Tax=Cladorrhinum samala TaxID=585594 RepID=A0AAV9HAD1_9PEZI|nr:putative integral membrane protein [Cladorrhinum samala]